MSEKPKVEHIELASQVSEADSFADVDRAKITRKVDLHLLPIFTILYLLSFLDRGNIGNAKIEGLAEDLNLVGNQYNLCLTIFFIFYASMEVPSNMILKRWRPELFVPLTVTLFAIVMTLMGTVKNYAQLMATRALLGIFESSLFPGISYILSMYYKKNELLVRQAIFFSAASMAGAFSGLLAAGISQMDGVGGYEGWRWIFILEGLVTLIFGLLSFWWFPTYPRNASFLTERERQFVVWNVQHLTNQIAMHPDAPKGEDTSSDRKFLWAVFKDPNCWFQLFTYLGVLLPLYGISLFTPTIIKNLGYTSTRAQLLSVPIYVVAAFLSVVQAFVSDRTGLRSPFLIFNYACMVVGFVICICLDPRVNPKGIYAAIYICALGIYPAIPLSIVWNANNLAGTYKRAIGIGFQIGLANYGGAFVSNFYRGQDSPRYVLGHSLTLAFIGMGAVALAGCIISYRVSNAKKEHAIESGETKGLTDAELLGMGDKNPYFRYRL
uniref:Major facilitator superfamily (MFS) profile domain-containing protein n=1 Tax=Candidozyma auris TaxID=498019 RepID=A0A0L0NR63_CANAR